MKIDNYRQIQNYSTWVESIFRNGNPLFHGNILFSRLGNDRNEINSRMRESVIGLYSNLVQQIERKPHSVARQHILPLAFFFPDLPIRAGKSNQRNAPNFGVHYHFLISINPSGCVANLSDHFGQKIDWYRKRLPQISEIHVERVTGTPRAAANYIFKWWRRGRFNADDLILLPSPSHEFAQRRIERRRSKTDDQILRQQQCSVEQFKKL